MRSAPAEGHARLPSDKDKASPRAFPHLSACRHLHMENLKESSPSRPVMPFIPSFFGKATPPKNAFFPLATGQRSPKPIKKSNETKRQRFYCFFGCRRLCGGWGGGGGMGCDPGQVRSIPCWPKGNFRVGAGVGWAGNLAPLNRNREGLFGSWCKPKRTPRIPKSLESKLEGK